jgi:hypothetical protein
MYLIVIEAESDLGGPVPNTYHYQPYRLASSVNEAIELMQEYLRLGPDSGALPPQYFALYVEKDGEFGFPDYYDPITLQPADATEWLAETGRC